MEENLLEQPLTEPDELSQICNDLKSETHDNGSMFGKFKDAKTLLEAYNSLQAEFTRKSQKLAEFQKNFEESAVFKNYNTLDDFINDTADGEKYKQEITEILINDNEVNNLPNKYQVAFKIIKEADNKIANKLKSQEFLDKYIINNETIKSQIINDYLSNLNNISSAPKVISGNSTNIYFSPNSDRPKTIKEAGEIFSKMLK